MLAGYLLFKTFKINQKLIISVKKIPLKIFQRLSNYSLPLENNLWDDGFSLTFIIFLLPPVLLEYLEFVFIQQTDTNLDISQQ